MAKMTFKFDLSKDAWTPIAAGSDYNAFGLMCASGTAKIFIGDTEPNNNEEDWIPISASDSREITTSIPSTMTVYAQAKSDDTTVRGFKVPAS